MYKNSSLPIFNKSLYLAGNPENNDMISMLLKPLSSLVIIDCIEYKGEFIQAIEDNLNNDANAKSWVSPEADSWYNFDYFYG